MGKKRREQSAEEQTAHEPSAKKVKQAPSAEMFNEGASTNKVPISPNTILEVFEGLHQFLEKLKQFLEELSDSLSYAHVEFVNKKIQQLEKDRKIANGLSKPSIAASALVETKMDNYLKPKIAKAGVGITKERNKELTREHKYTGLEKNGRDFFDQFEEETPTGKMPISLATIMEIIEDLQKKKANEMRGRTISYGLDALLKNRRFEGNIDANAIQSVLYYGKNGKSVSNHPSYPKYSDEDQKHQVIVKLKQFLENFGDFFTDIQIEFVNKKIEQLEKDEKIANELTTPSIAKPALVETKIDDYLKPKIEEAEVRITKERNKEFTAFDFYKLSREHKYTELDKDYRDAKLRRHFERLDESKRAKFEEQAENQ